MTKPKVGDKVEPPCVACGGASPTSRLCERCEAHGVEAPELPFDESNNPVFLLQ